MTLSCCMFAWMRLTDYRPKLVLEKEKSVKNLAELYNTMATENQEDVPTQLANKKLGRQSSRSPTSPTAESLITLTDETEPATVQQIPENDVQPSLDYMIKEEVATEEGQAEATPLVEQSPIEETVDKGTTVDEIRDTVVTEGPVLDETPVEQVPAEETNAEEQSPVDKKEDEAEEEEEVVLEEGSAEEAVINEIPDEKVAPEESLNEVSAQGSEIEEQVAAEVDVSAEKQVTAEETIVEKASELQAQVTAEEREREELVNAIIDNLDEIENEQMEKFLQETAPVVESEQDIVGTENPAADNEVKESSNDVVEPIEGAEEATKESKKSKKSSKKESKKNKDESKSTKDDDPKYSLRRFSKKSSKKDKKEKK